jgi:hypothetical protein
MSDRLLGSIHMIVLRLPVVLTVALVLFGSEAHAQPTDWSSYQLGRNQTGYYQGTAPNGELWTGQSHTSGHTTYFDAYGPNGQTKHCESYKLGLSAYTDCAMPLPASAVVASAGANSARHGGKTAHLVAADLRTDQHSARVHRQEGREKVAMDGSGSGPVGKVRGITIASVHHLSHTLPNSSAAQ